MTERSVIREQQGSARTASVISTITGGAIIVAAVYFGMLDTSWPVASGRLSHIRPVISSRRGLGA